METPRISIHLHIQDFPSDDLHVRKLLGRESLSQLFTLTLEVVAPRRLVLDDLSGANCSITLEHDDTVLRTLYGMIIGVEDQLKSETRFHVYKLHVAPRAYRLAMISTQEVYLDCTVPRIIEQKLLLMGMSNDDFEFRLLANYPQRDFVVQYKETDIQFISRLCEHLGISFFFDHQKGYDQWIFTDHSEGFSLHHKAVFRPRGDSTGVFFLRARQRILPTNFVVQDYNYRHPMVDVFATHALEEGFGGGVVEFAPHVKSTEEAEALARIRAEEALSTQLTYLVKSDQMNWSAGCKVLVEQHPHFESLELLLVELRHEAFLPLPGFDAPTKKPRYRNTAHAIPSDRTYRPARITPKPRIQGFLTGTIEAEVGAVNPIHANLDEQGRYIVRFHFDTASEDGIKASKRIRMAQQNAGPDFGTHFPLRPGTEVLLAFADGDPDRPIIIGAVPNPITPTPITRTQATSNRIKSATGIIIEFEDGV